jgi:amidase
MGRTGMTEASIILLTHLGESNAQYTTVWNVLDYPALVIPVSKVDPNLDKAKPAYTFLSRADKAHHETCACLHILIDNRLFLIATIDTPEVYANAPIAVQVVARTLEEEAVIAMSEIVDAALKVPVLARL